MEWFVCDYNVPFICDCNVPFIWNVLTFGVECKIIL